MSPIESNALTVSIPTSFGVAAAYHIIKSISLDDINQQMTFVVSSYSSKEAYDGGMANLMQCSYTTLSTGDYQSLLISQNFFESCYSYLLQNIAPFNQ